MVLQCDRELGLSLQQREEVYKQALRVAQEVAFPRLWRAAQADLEAAAAKLTEMVADEAVDAEVGDGDLAFVFEENSAEVERLLFGYIREAMVNSPGFPFG